MIDRDAQRILDAEHREQQRITSRLATELHAARAVVAEARLASTSTLGMLDALAAYDEAVAHEA